MDARALSEKNPNLAILEPQDPRLARYGRIVEPSGMDALLVLADSIAPANLPSNLYVASEGRLEAHEAAASLGPYFGFAALQVGYNAGPNSRLNGLEWHGSPELLMAVTDLALFLGREEDILWDGPDSPSYGSGHLACLFLPRGAALRILPGTLHLSPCRLSESGFKSVVVLPRGTNSPLSDEERALAREAAARGDGPARLLFARNKWILAHPEREILTDQGAHPGIVGDNLEVRF